ncbi:MAG: ATP-binding protein [Syntrophobacteraceae bacterium]
MRKRTSRPRIRTYLMALVLSCLVPVCLASAYLIKYSYRARMALLDQNLQTASSALSSALDRDLATAQRSLEALATSPAIALGDFAAFHAQVLRVAKDYPGSDIIMADATGQQIVNSYRSFGSQLPKRNPSDTVRRIFETGKPCLTNLFRGAVTGRYLIGVDVPVFDGSQVRYDLAMTMPADNLLPLLRNNTLNPEWLITILDGNKTIVARSRMPEDFVGKPIVSPPLLKIMAGAEQGSTEGMNLQGIRSLVSFQRSARTGWTVLVSTPKALMVQELQHWLLWVVVCLSALLLLGFGLVMKFTRTISRSVQSLVGPAMALGRGEPVQPGDFELKETFEVGNALLRASELLHETRVSRDELRKEVNERRRVEEELRESEARRVAAEAAESERKRFLDVLETLPVYVCLLRPDYHVAFANRVFRERFGESEEGLRCFEALFGRTDPCEICMTYKVLEDMAPRKWQWTGPDQRDYSVFDFPFTNTDGSTLILEMGIDVTEQKKAEAELTATISRLELINLELQEFAFIASHDLQEPLRKIQTFADILRKKCSANLDENGISYLSRMEQSAARMRRLIHDLLQFSRVATKPEPYKPVNLDELLQDVLQVFEHSLEKGAVVRISDLPVIDAEESQMKQLFQNLLGNALKYRKKDVPPEIRIYCTKEKNNRCRIVIEDNGIGFEQEYALKIFAPFQRLHVREYEGTGMGLAICRKIVERHGGDITAASQPGVGSTFIINLPFKQKRLELS